MELLCHCTILVTGHLHLESRKQFQGKKSQKTVSKKIIIRIEGRISLEEMSDLRVIKLRCET